MKYLIPVCLALSAAACSQAEAPLPSPTVIAATSNTLCGTEITSLNMDVNYSGPYLTIDIAFAGAPAPVEIEIERYLANGQTEPFAKLTNVVGHVRVDLAFNTTYRARARAGSCTTWSPWVDRQVGPPNPCGDCGKTPPPQPPPPEEPPPPSEPPPPPPPPDDGEQPPVPCPWDLAFHVDPVSRQGVWSVVCGELALR